MGLFQDQIASIGLDHALKIIDISTFSIFMAKDLERCYLTALHTTPSTILVGNGHGSLTILDPKTLDIVKTRKLHSDSITDILEEGNQMVTCGNDGVVQFMDKRNFGVLQSFQMETPVNQVVKFNGKYYLAGERAYTLSP
jgi:WD40 repeat protein